MKRLVDLPEYVTAANDVILGAVDDDDPFCPLRKIIAANDHLRHIARRLVEVFRAQRSARINMRKANIVLVVFDVASDIEVQWRVPEVLPDRIRYQLPMDSRWRFLLHGH